MNQFFADSTTSISFVLTLSRRQCNSLLRLLEAEAANDPTAAAKERVWVLAVDGLKSLDRRGLVYWNYNDKGEACGFAGMTKAGRIAAQLLVEAGLTVENTNTALVNKRLQQVAAG